MRRLIGSTIIIGVVVGAFAVGQAGRNTDRAERKSTTPVSKTETRTTVTTPASQVVRLRENPTNAATEGVPGASVIPMQPVEASESGDPAPSTATVDDSGVRDPEAEPMTPPSSPSPAAAVYEINWSSLNVGGGPSSSPTYENEATAGQSAIGESSSPTYTMQSGYWYGAFVVVDGCMCDCHGDPVCSGVVDVFDVVACVDEAFRNGPPVIDPNGSCPASSDNDVANCNGLVDVFDVVNMVEVAFRNGDPNTVFCDPCP